ncbi:MAG: bifunctional 5,10-methylenetetrahydrofolate dehydrogenase/5,10-methenyltetrahydrofolate cyclohydrolase [Rickettsiales endosymbiont of Dermacentor nuttalli]
MSNIIDGKKIANSICNELSKKLIILKSKYGIIPGLAVLLVGNDPVSEVYVKNKISKCKELGINSFEIQLPENVLQNQLIKKLEFLNNDPKVHGILVQLPLPKHIDTDVIINTIVPNKDVDGFSNINVGRLVNNLPGFVPCTPLGCLQLIKSVRTNLSGLKAVIVGRSSIVGKPMLYLLLQENCTVSIVHSKTVNIEDEVKTADIVVAAVGVPELVNSDWIKPGTIVIDVGINRIIRGKKSMLVGDVNFEKVKDIAEYITPVPGGVGPMTIAYLISNTIKAACISKNIDIDKIII